MTVSDCLKNLAVTLGSYAKFLMVLAQAQCDPEKSIADCFLLTQGQPEACGFVFTELGKVLSIQWLHTSMYMSKTKVNHLYPDANFHLLTPCVLVDFPSKFKPC